MRVARWFGARARRTGLRDESKGTVEHDSRAFSSAPVHICSCCSQRPDRFSLIHQSRARPKPAALLILIRPSLSTAFWPVFLLFTPLSPVVIQRAHVFLSPLIAVVAAPVPDPVPLVFTFVFRLRFSSLSPSRLFVHPRLAFRPSNNIGNGVTDAGVAALYASVSVVVVVAFRSLSRPRR